MKIKDIKLEDVAAGKNWKVRDGSGTFEVDLSGSARVEFIQLEIEEAEEFTEDDYIVYSGIFLADSGRALPLLLVKRVGDFDYGGDYCEIHEGRWRKLGLEPNPDAEFGFEFFASPLEEDPSFASDQDELRAENRHQFLLHSHQLLS